MTHLEAATKENDDATAGSVAAAREPRPALVIRPTRGFAALGLRELWRFRELLVTLAVRDVKLRYKQTALGIAWVVLQPLIATVVLTFVFSRVAGLQAPGGAPYPLFTFCGMVAWTVFSGTLSRASRALVSDAHLVSKVYFPRLILPLSATGSVIVDLVVALGVLGVLMAAWAWVPSATILLAPIFIALLFVLGLGVGLCAGGLAVTYRDVHHMVPLLIQTLLFASPVAYWSGQVPPEYVGLYSLNPLVGLIDGFRWSVLGVGAANPMAVGYAIVFSVSVLVAGAFWFRRMERRFADVI